MSANGHVLRRLEPRDVPQVKLLCSDCFPIEYTDNWFKYITSTKVCNATIVIRAIFDSWLDWAGVFSRLFFVV